MKSIECYHICSEDKFKQLIRNGEISDDIMLAWYRPLNKVDVSTENADKSYILRLNVKDYKPDNQFKESLVCEQTNQEDTHILMNTVKAEWVKAVHRCDKVWA